MTQPPEQPPEQSPEQPPEQPPANPPKSAYPPTAPVHGVSGAGGDAPARDPKADAMLIQFVRDRDAPCPRCGYNVRNLTKPVCPECHELLTLRVGLQELRIGKLIAAIIPGIFSGLCGIVLLIILLYAPNSGGGPVPWQLVLLDAFGLASGVLAMVIILKRRAFLKLGDERQVTIAAAMWFGHIAAFVILMYATMM